jgi:hypothetical protein
MFDIFEVNENLDAFGMILVENVDGPNEEFWAQNLHCNFSGIFDAERKKTDQIGVEIEVRLLSPLGYMSN